MRSRAYDAMTARVTFRRRCAVIYASPAPEPWLTRGRARHSYCNRSNTTRKLRTPGGKLVLQYTPKKAKGPQTPAGDQGRIHGVRARYAAPLPLRLEFEVQQP